MHIIAIQTCVYLTKRLARQVNVEQIVVAQRHQIAQRMGLRHRQCGTEAPEKTFNEQVVLEQSTTAAPAQFAQGAFVNQFFCHTDSFCASDSAQDHHFLDLADRLGGV